MYKILSIGILLLWVSAMAALVARDLWPEWTAQDAPPLTPDQLAVLDNPEKQYAIDRADGRPIGTAWSKAARSGTGLLLTGTVLLDHLPHLPPVAIQSFTEFNEAGELDSFRLRVHGIRLHGNQEARIHVRGQRRGITFPLEMQLGPIRRQVSLDASASRMIGESMRPFSFLPTLEVGQSWRMQVLDPLSAALRGQAAFTSLIARVTDRQRIEYPEGSGQWIECFVVETSPRESKAWVNPQGEVIVQEVEVPGIGKVTVREERFDEDRREAATELIRPSTRPDDDESNSNEDMP